MRLYTHVSLKELAQRIVSLSDRQALEEFHERKPLIDSSKGALRLVEFVAELRNRFLGSRRGRMDLLVVEKAYDLTIRKFSEFPDPAGNPTLLKRKSLDCRYYFQAYILGVERLGRVSDVHPLEREQQEGRILQGLVTWHFNLSCREALRRARGTWRGMTLKLGFLKFSLRVPVLYQRSEVQAWLTDRLGPIEELTLADQTRIQDLIDRHFLSARILTYEDYLGAQVVHAPVREALESEMTAGDLASEVVAQKVRTIDRQRPAIRALGVQRLRELIEQAFADLSEGQYDDGNLARRFGLSKATFSRFAGSRWKLSAVDRLRPRAIPDLWRNTAKVLATNPMFIQAAKECGVWSEVLEVLDRVPKE
jgi:hypothetical protein